MRRCLLFILFVMLTTSQLWASLRWQAVRNWFDSADFSGSDTLYVRLPKQKFMAYANTGLSNSLLNFSFVNNSMNPPVELSGNLASKQTQSLSFGMWYRGWGLSYSFELYDHRDSEFMYTFYGKRYGIEFRVHNSKSHSGTFSDSSEALNFDINPGQISQKLYLANLYWVFNDKKFSLPAALSQTVIQRCSAGSWLASFNYYRSSIRPNLNNPAGNYTSFMVDVQKLSSSQISVGGGYAYNYVFCNERCLLHASVMPMVSVWHRNRVYTSTETTPLSQDISLNGNAHLGLIYNHSRYVSGMSFIYNLEWVDLKNDLSILDSNWAGRVFIGVRF